MEHHEKIYLYKRIVKAKLFIDIHYADNIDLEHIADQAHFSKYHFIRLFKSIYGRTPKNYLIKVRIDKAKLLLASGRSVLETGLTIGLDSPTSFAGMFKKIVGITPSAFQKEQIARKDSIIENPLHFVPSCYAQRYGWVKPQF